MRIEDAIKQVLTDVCGEDLQRQRSALWEVCNASLVGESLLQRVLVLLPEDTRRVAFVICECERLLNGLRLQFPQWEICLGKAVLQQYCTYDEAAIDYQRLKRTMRSTRLSLHRIESEPRALEVG